MQCASFQAKTSTLYFGRKSQLVVSRGIFIRNLIDFFFFFYKKAFPSGTQVAETRVFHINTINFILFLAKMTKTLWIC